MRGVRVRVTDVSTNVVNTLETLLGGPGFATFGCAEGGLHRDDKGRLACERCQHDQARTGFPAGGSKPFVDDRGAPDTWWRDEDDQAWPHTRWLDAYGRLHRDGDEPALIAPDLQVWARHGRIVRTHGLPSIIRDDDQWAYTDERGLIHRLAGAGPAVQWEGTSEFWCHGVLSRPDGPAITEPRGYHAFWLDGEPMSRRDLWARWTARHGVALHNTEAQRMLYDLHDISDDLTAPFPELSPMSVQITLTVCRN